MNFISPIKTGVLLLILVINGFALEKEEKETIQKTLTFSNPSGETRLIIDNINGSIDVTGYDGDKVEVVVHRTTWARSDENLELAKHKITLEISENDNVIELYVDAPYRRRDGSMNHRGWRHYGYDAEFDFEIKVPRETDVMAKTINDGEITVSSVKGDFEIDNINGGIEMKGAAGSGRVYALNGDVIVSFDENPEKDCFFGSLNGEIEVAFKPGFSADFRFKTFNGQVYTDFDMTYLRPRKATQRRKGGKFVYKADRSFGARVGDGGPEMEFDGFNGDIHVIEK